MPSVPGNMASPATSSTPRRSLAREPHLSGDFAGAVRFSGAGLRSPIPAGWRKPMRRCSAARAAAPCRRCPHPRTIRRAMAGGDQPGCGDGPRGGGGDGSVVRPGVRAARLCNPAAGQTWLPSAPEAARQRRAASPRAGFRSRLLPRADEPRHSPDHRRRVRPTGTRRRGRCRSSEAVPRARNDCFRWATRSTPTPGRVRGPVCRTCCR